MGLGLMGISAVTLITLRASLDREVDSSILNVASIQAASLTDAPSGEMHFHEWDLTPDEAASVRDLVRFAQVWQADGVSLQRSQYMTQDLPLDREHLSRAGNGELVWVDLDWDGLPIRSLYYPLERLGEAHQRHVLQVAAPLEARNELMGRVAGFLGLLVLVLNESNEVRSVELQGRLDWWLPAAKKYTATRFDWTGRERDKVIFNHAQWRLTTPNLKPEELICYTIEAERISQTQSQ